MRSLVKTLELQACSCCVLLTLTFLSRTGLTDQQLLDSIQVLNLYKLLVCIAGLCNGNHDKKAFLELRGLQAVLETHAIIAPPITLQLRTRGLATVEVRSSLRPGPVPETADCTTALDVQAVGELQEQQHATRCCKRNL